MSNRYTAPEDIQIAALNKTRDQQYFDLMRPGPGTPWEDRGKLGTVGGFFKTCIMSLTSPAKLFDMIRRPETSGDATQFLISIGVIWAVSVVIHAALLLQFHYKRLSDGTVDTSTFWIETGIRAVLMPAVIWLLAKISSAVYFKMIAHDMKSPGRPVLVYNIFAYTLGPSLLSLIPVIGPPLALLMIFINWVIAGTRRLYVKTSAAIIATVLVFIMTMVMFSVIYYVGNYALESMLGNPVQQFLIPTALPAH